MNTSPRAARRASNQGRLLFSLLPIGATAFFCLVTAGQRALVAADASPSAEPKQAQQAARDYCTQIVGDDAHVKEVSQQITFAQRGQRPVRVWDIVCNSPAGGGEYLLRINADTKQVFGVNRLTDLQAASSEEGCSQAMAEDRAKRYLGLLGIPAHRLQRVPSHGAPLCKRRPASWSFTYRHTEPGRKKYALSVSVDATTGNLVCACIPEFIV